MEIKLQCGDRIAIPTGCKATVSDGYVLVEAEKPEFKRGDFVFAFGDVHIVSNIDGDEVHFDVCVVLSSKKVYFERDFGLELHFRHATPEERTKLLEAMHAAGKDWDAEKQEVVDWVWMPKMGEDYFMISDMGKVMECSWDDFGTDKKRAEEKCIFRTRELAEAALEMLKQCKHY